LALTLWEAEQTLPGTALADPSGELLNQLKALKEKIRIKAGDRVGITVGSRGIAQLVPLLSAIVNYLQEKGAGAEIIAAMGSHGGGTAAGQLKVLEELGITPDRFKVPVRSSGSFTELGSLPDGFQVAVNTLALEYDALLVFNRVKPHTAFSGPVESGLLKMLAVGLGGPEGAYRIHGQGAGGLAQRIPEVGEYLVQHLPVACGIAVAENGNQQIARIQVGLPAEFRSIDETLLSEAAKLLARLPFAALDILVVGAMGKRFSGTGMDTNVIGRRGIPGEPDSQLIKRLVVLDLAGGNANGIGLADVISRAAFNKINFRETYTNVLATGFLPRGKIPLVAADDREALIWAAHSLNQAQKELKIAVIENTLALSRFWISEPLAAEASDLGLTLKKQIDFDFDAQGRLIWPISSR